MLKELPEGFSEIDSSRIEKPGRPMVMPNPYATEETCANNKAEQQETPAQVVTVQPSRHDSKHTAVRLPSYEKLQNDRILYAHASRVMHLEVVTPIDLFSI
ncbi:hypothetical protein PDPUS_1_02097 [Photobacterium damselae subsp. piscicida]|uniref:Uncharacterized protein n=1 Tax=Photobacterium damsela subsp. piscicida TaxID=38294 RepID=A0AAD1CH60_PHODP|nr:hypothetical protein PDPUS_1_02097 [Photobacterium damselae subsp. piscicida]GAW42781.1 hypothetical protein PDPJ_1_00195 [Photobacterium damselae subsp. piscicida]